MVYQSYVIILATELIIYKTRKETGDVSKQNQK